MGIVYIMRGLPGAGKSTKVKQLAEEFAEDYVYCSADSYFEKSDKYEFDRSKLWLAHKKCWDDFVWGVSVSPERYVIVDNTNTTFKEYQKYVDFAKSYKWKVIIVDLYDGGLTDIELTIRNKHGVPLEAIQRMRARYERDLKMDR